VVYAGTAKKSQADNPISVALSQRSLTLNPSSSKKDDPNIVGPPPTDSVGGDPTNSMTTPISLPLSHQFMLPRSQSGFVGEYKNTSPRKGNGAKKKQQLKKKKKKKRKGVQPPTQYSAQISSKHTNPLEVDTKMRSSSGGSLEFDGSPKISTHSTLEDDEYHFDPNEDTPSPTVREEVFF